MQCFPVCIRHLESLYRFYTSKVTLKKLNFPERAKQLFFNLTKNYSQKINQIILAKKRYILNMKIIFVAFVSQVLKNYSFELMILMIFL